MQARREETIREGQRGGCGGRSCDKIKEKKVIKVGKSRTTRGTKKRGEAKKK